MADDDEDQGQPLGGSVTDAARAAGDHDYKPASYTPVEGWAAPEPPELVARYLMPGELRAGVIAVRQHWIVLVLPALAAGGGLLAAIATNGWLYEDGKASAAAVHTLWITYLCGVLWAAGKYVSWRYRWFVVTGGRLMTVGGVLRRRVTPLPLKRVRDLELQQSALGLQFGYGTIECESIATDHALHTVNYLPFTTEIWTQIWQKLLPSVATGVRFEGMQEDVW